MAEVETNLPCLFIQSGFQYLQTQIWSTHSVLVARMAVTISCRKTRLPSSKSLSLVENTEQSPELFMHLTNLEKSTGTNLLPPRPTTDTMPWSDPEQAAIAQSTVAHGCSLTEDLRQAFLFPEAPRSPARWRGDGFTGEHYLTSDWIQTCSQTIAHRAVSVSPSLPSNPHTLRRP